MRVCADEGRSAEQIPPLIGASSTHLSYPQTNCHKENPERTFISLDTLCKAITNGQIVLVVYLHPK